MICRAGAPHHCRDPSCDRRALGRGQRCARPPALPLTLAWSPAEGRDTGLPWGSAHWGLGTPQGGAGTPTPESLVGPMLIFYLFESGAGSGFKVSLE